jgi:prepilin-type processing-associated H-X9-DG protein
MKTKIKAFTVLELLIVILVVIVFAGLFLPYSFDDRGRTKAIRINCVCNLKQVGLAFRLWSDDNNSMYPMQYYTNQSGVLLFADATNEFRYFQAMSNELSTPKILVCPADKRIAATNFTTDFSGARVSYFVALEANEMFPNRLLSGDRNITNGRSPRNGILEANTNQNIGWTSELHNGFGNVGLADGSVQQFTINGLRNCVGHTGLATNRLLLPP